MSVKALIIDDNQANLIVLKQALELEGVTSLLCDTPRNLPAVLDEGGQVNVIFLDLEFPNYSGLGLIHELKRDPRLADATFVAYTVHTSERNEAHAAGFHSFLGKPLNVEEFPHQLRRILDGERVWDAG